MVLICIFCTLCWTHIPVIVCSYMVKAFIYWKIDYTCTLNIYLIRCILNWVNLWSITWNCIFYFIYPKHTASVLLVTAVIKTEKWGKGSSYLRIRCYVLESGGESSSWENGGGAGGNSRRGSFHHQLEYLLTSRERSQLKKALQIYAERRYGDKSPRLSWKTCINCIWFCPRLFYLHCLGGFCLHYNHQDILII